MILHDGDAQERHIVFAYNLGEHVWWAGVEWNIAGRGYREFAADCSLAEYVYDLALPETPLSPIRQVTETDIYRLE